MRTREIAEQIAIPAEKMPSFYGAVAQLYANGHLIRVDRGTYILSPHGEAIIERNRSS